MIATVTGVVAEIDAASVVVETQGIGYQVFAPTSVLQSVKVGAKTRLFTSLVVREDSMTLFGFSTVEQRETFKLLNTVSGVGPKLSIAILSAMNTDSLTKAVAAEDIDALTVVPGLGKRGAQRIVMELKEKLTSGLQIGGSPGSAHVEVRDALIGLGYSPLEIRDVLDRVDVEGDVEKIVRAALKELARV